MKEYYKAYDKRYQQVHNKNLSWSSNNNSKIVEECLKKYKINKASSILEIGCGEGRDARYLLQKGYKILATDVSNEAIKFCKEKDISNVNNYQVLDVLGSKKFNAKFDFIYSVACIHMLTLDSDRNKYYQFIYNHLKDDAYALILSLGDGVKEFISDTTIAWEDQPRIHEETKQELLLAATTCRIVNFNTLFNELENNNFSIIEHGITEIEPDFREIMYVVIKKSKKK